MTKVVVLSDSFEEINSTSHQPTYLQKRGKFYQSAKLVLVRFRALIKAHSCSTTLQTHFSGVELGCILTCPQAWEGACMDVSVDMAALENKKSLLHPLG